MNNPLVEYMKENDVSIEELFYIKGVKTVWEKVNDTGRWQNFMSTVFEFQDRYYQVDWASGLTEMQEDEYDELPFEVKKNVILSKETLWSPIDAEEKEDEKIADELNSLEMVSENLDLTGLKKFVKSEEYASFVTNIETLVKELNLHDELDVSLRLNVTVETLKELKDLA